MTDTKETMQVMFNIAAAKGLKQNKRSYQYKDDGTIPSTCAYRGINNTACFVGWLMSDDAYRPEAEGQGADQEDVLTVLASSGWKIVDDDLSYDKKLIQFLIDMQAVHDGSDICDWAGELRYIARKHDLNDDVVTNYDSPLYDQTQLPIDSGCNSQDIEYTKQASGHADSRDTVDLSMRGVLEGQSKVQQG